MNEPRWSDARGTGEALNGKVRVTITAGRVSDVALDPRALRMSSHELAEAFRGATNAAIEAFGEQATVYQPVVPPAEELARRLDEVSMDAMRAMAESSRGIHDAINAIQRLSDLHRGR